MARVSVIIPTYNRRDYVQEAIDSVMAQTFTDYEVIVVDDGSDDGTGEILRKRYGNRIRYEWQRNQGESVARNHGIALAQGDFVAFLDSDDLWLSENAAMQVQSLEINADAVMGCAQAWLVDADGRVVEDSPWGDDLSMADFTFEQLVLGNHVICSTAFVRRDALDQTGGFDPKIRYGEDWDLWLRLTSFGSIRFLSQPLACIRRHNTAQTSFCNAYATDRILEDHLRIVTRALALTSTEHRTKLHDQALARCYGRAAVLDYASGRTDTGQDRLNRAIRLDKAVWADTDTFTDLLRYRLLGTLPSGTEGMALTIAILGKALLDLPLVLTPSYRKRCRLVSEALVDRCYVAYRAADWAAVRYGVRSAVLHTPKLLLNRGFVSLAIESLIGSDRVSWLRKLPGL